jgi:hypothetical protein
MQHHVAVLALVTLTTLGSQTAFAQDTTSAKGFLKTLYAAYTPHGEPPALDANASPALLQLLKEDEQLLQGDEGALGSDPVCECQDWGNLKTTDIKVEMSGHDKANATVSFSNFHKPHKVRFELAWDHGAWRIDDITGDTYPQGIREILKAEIAQLRNESHK